jgi:iron complex transport system substrate-binding protein
VRHESASFGSLRSWRSWRETRSGRSLRALRLCERFGHLRAASNPVVCLALLVLAACAPPPDWGEGEIGEAAAVAAEGPVAVEDDAGRTVRLDRPAARVVSLLPATTETLLALGGEPLLVARTDFDDDPRVAHLPSVGGGLTPSIEVLASLRPDLVIAWEEAGTARVRPRLEELGIAVFAARTQDTTGVFANIRRLGHLIGRDAAADSLALAIRSELIGVRASVEGLPSPSVLYMVSLDPPMIASPTVFMGQLVEVAGGRSAFPEITAPSPQISLEEIVRRRPDVVILPRHGDERAVIERLRGSAGWRQLLEGGHTRFRTVPADTLSRPGPSIARAAWLLRDAIHGPVAAEARP